MLVCKRFDERFKQLVFLFLVQLVQNVSKLFGHMISVIVGCDEDTDGDYTRCVEFYRRTYHEVAAQLTGRTFRRTFRMDHDALD